MPHRDATPPKAPDLFSNVSLLSMLSRSQSARSTTSQSSRSLTSSNKKTEKDSSPSLNSTKSRISVSFSSQRSEEATAEKITNGSNTYVSIYSYDSYDRIENYNSSILKYKILSYLF